MMETATSKEKHTTRFIYCDLHTDEVLKYSEELAKKQLEAEKLERDIKAMRTTMNMRKLEVSELAVKVDDKKELRDVECIITYSKAGSKYMAHINRKDTYELVDTREMTDEEIEEYNNPELPGTEPGELTDDE